MDSFLKIFRRKKDEFNGLVYYFLITKLIFKKACLKFNWSRLFYFRLLDKSRGTYANRPSPLRGSGGEGVQGEG